MDNIVIETTHNKLIQVRDFLKNNDQLIHSEYHINYHNLDNDKVYVYFYKNRWDWGYTDKMKLVNFFKNKKIIYTEFEQMIREHKLNKILNDR